MAWAGDAQAVGIAGRKPTDGGPLLLRCEELEQQRSEEEAA